jgi:hypothetical protein
MDDCGHEGRLEANLSRLNDCYLRFRAKEQLDAMGSVHVRSTAIYQAALGLCCLLALTGQAVGAESAATAVVDPLISMHEGFVDEKKCASCHTDEAEAFAKSHHAKAMALAGDTTVRADFNDVQFDHDGIVTSFFRRGVRGQIHLCLRAAAAVPYRSRWRAIAGSRHRLGHQQAGMVLAWRRQTR